MNTQNQSPFIPELPPNPDKIQKLFALRELLQKVADLKDQDNNTLFNYGDSHFRCGKMEEHPIVKTLSNEKPGHIHVCGTPACVAGWTGFLDPERSIRDEQYWDWNKEHAAKFLELTEGETNFLFLCQEYIDQDGTIIYPHWAEQDDDWLTLSDIPIKEAIKRIDFIIKQNE